MADKKGEHRFNGTQVQLIGAAGVVLGLILLFISRSSMATGGIATLLLIIGAVLFAIGSVRASSDAKAKKKTPPAP